MKKKFEIIKKIPPTIEEFLNPENGWVTQKFIDSFEGEKRTDDELIKTWVK